MVLFSIPSLSPRSTTFLAQQRQGFRFHPTLSAKKGTTRLACSGSIRESEGSKPTRRRRSRHRITSTMASWWTLSWRMSLSRERLRARDGPIGTRASVGHAVRCAAWPIGARAPMGQARVPNRQVRNLLHASVQNNVHRQHTSHQHQRQSNPFMKLIVLRQTSSVAWLGLQGRLLHPLGLFSGTAALQRASSARLSASTHCWAALRRAAFSSRYQVPGTSLEVSAFNLAIACYTWQM